MKVNIPLTGIVLLLLLTNCKKTEKSISGPVRISRDLIYLDSRKGSSDTFQVIAEGDWQLSNPAAYKDFTFNPTSGRGNAIVTVTVQAQNTSNKGISFPFSASSGTNYASSRVLQDAFMPDAEFMIIGTAGNDEIAQSIPTSDGGSLHVGSSTGTSSQIRENAGKSDVLLIKTDNKGTVTWTRTFGGTEDDFGFSCIESNGSYFITGESYSNSIGFEGNKGKSDLLLIKTDKAGNLIWQKKYGGSETESGRKIRLSPDNNIIVMGNSRSRDGDIPPTPGTSTRVKTQRGWILQFDQNGLITSQTIDPSQAETEFYDFQITSATNVVMAGYRLEERGSIPAPVLNKNIFARHLSLDPNYQNTWGISEDGYQDESARACITAADGGTITVGNGNGIIAESGPTGTGAQAYFVKYTSAGTLAWKREWGRSGDELIFDIQPAGPGRYIVCGATSSFMNYPGDRKPNLDGWVLEINEFGMVQWEQNFGGNGDDVFTSVVPLGNNEYLLSGKTNSTKIQNTSKPNSGDDAWIVRIKR